MLKHLPNTLTCLNLLCGVISILYATQGRYDLCLLLMVISAVFDFLDGFAARLLKAYSAIGKELDSLADLVSFGVVPAILLQERFAQTVLLAQLPEYLGWFPLILAAFSALRLAKFNLDDRQTDNFIGLPTPAAALMIATGLYASASSGTNGLWNIWLNEPYTIPLVTLLVAYLLVSGQPMFSMKIKSLKWKDNQLRYTYLILVALSLPAWALIGLKFASWPFFVFTSYLVLNLIKNIYTVIVKNQLKS